MTQLEIDEQIRKTPLLVRLQKCREMIYQMCGDLRPPMMSVPPQASDEDMILDATLEEAIRRIKELERQTKIK